MLRTTCSNQFPGPSGRLPDQRLEAGIELYAHCSGWTELTQELADMHLGNTTESELEQALNCDPPQLTTKRIPNTSCHPQGFGSCPQE